MVFFVYSDNLYEKKIHRHGDKHIFNHDPGVLNCHLMADWYLFTRVYWLFEKSGVIRAAS